MSGAAGGALETAFGIGTAAALKKAMKTVEILGCVPEELAEILGAEAGTDYLVVIANQGKAASVRSEAERLKADGPIKAADNAKRNERDS